MILLFPVTDLYGNEFYPLTEEQKYNLYYHAVAKPCATVMGINETNIIIVISALIQDPPIVYGEQHQWDSFIKRQKLKCSMFPALTFYEIVFYKLFI